MTYVGDGENSAAVLAARDQLSRPGVGSVVATGSRTNGDFGLFRGTLAAGSDVAPHFHRTFSESFYVLSGGIELWNGVAWSSASVVAFFDISSTVCARRAAFWAFNGSPPSVCSQKTYQETASM